MAITKITLVERFGIIQSDGSIGIMPESYTLEKARQEAHDPNQTDPHQQAKIGKVEFRVKEIVYDPVDALPPEVAAAAREEELIGALRFYAYAWDSTHKPIMGSPMYSGNGHERMVGVDVKTMPNGQLMEDCGTKARTVLNDLGVL
jgi:hypothetical protein